MNNGKLSFGGKAKGLLGAPADTFNRVAPEALGTALKFFAIWAAVYAVLQTIMFYTVARGVFDTLWESLGLGGATVFGLNPVIFGLLTVVGALVSLFVGGSWAHIFVRAFGGRKGYTNTIKAFAYGHTPALMFGWIPFAGALAYGNTTALLVVWIPLVGTAFSIWALILDIIGIRQLHGISTGRAIGAVLVSIVALGIIVALIVLGVVLLIVFAAG
jgi:hypothetical protein